MVTNGQNTSAFILSLLIFVFKCAHSLIHVNWTNDDIHENQQLQSLLKGMKPVIFYKVMHVLTDHPIRYGDQQQRCDDKNGNLQHYKHSWNKTSALHVFPLPWLGHSRNHPVRDSLKVFRITAVLPERKQSEGSLSGDFLGRVRAVTQATYQSVLSSEKLHEHYTLCQKHMLLTLCIIKLEEGQGFRSCWCLFCFSIWIA